MWEERFGEHVYVPLADAAFADALKQARLTPSDVDVLVVAGTHGRAARAFAGGAGVAQVADDLARVARQHRHRPRRAAAGRRAGPGAEPGQTIVVVVLADGATAMVVCAPPRRSPHRRGSTVAEQIAGATTRCATPPS